MAVGASWTSPATSAQARRRALVVGCSPAALVADLVLAELMLAALAPPARRTTPTRPGTWTPRTQLYRPEAVAGALVTAGFAIEARLDPEPYPERRAPDPAELPPRAEAPNARCGVSLSHPSSRST